MKRPIIALLLCLLLLLAGCSEKSDNSLYDDIYAKAYADAYEKVYGEASTEATEEPAEEAVEIPAAVEAEPVSNGIGRGTYTASEIFEKCCPSTVFIETSNGGGSGFFLEENVIATNNHVIDGANWIIVQTQDGQRYDVTTILARSGHPDLALLQIEGSGTPLKLNTHGVTEGEPLYCIGAPMGIYPCISDGIVMKSSHMDGDVEFILSNYHSIGGNSGGPVLNAYGELVGVVVGGMSDGPNAIDMVIHGQYLETLDRSCPESISTQSEWMEKMNEPEENKYEHASLADAQPGQIVTLGRYEQDGDEGNGTEDIYWLVMERNGDELTLMSLYCLDSAAYSHDMAPVTWETSYVREFLNGEFLQKAFSGEEQALILETLVINNDNPSHGTPGGNDTTDKVYLPSLEEIMRWYDIPAEETFFDHLYGAATEAAMQKNLWLEIPGSNRCWWWLRSPGGCEENACEVGSAGYFSLNGSIVTEEARALRPVICVNAG